MFNDFTHHAYQLAIFIDAGVIAADEFSVACRKKLDIGSFSPQFLPVFPGMPEEIPRLHIQSDSGYAISLSGLRVDLIVDKAYGLSDGDRAIYLNNVEALISILEEAGAAFVRAGLVRRYYKIMSDPARFVSNLFGGKGGKDLVDFGVNGVVRAEFKSRECNSVFNMSAGMIRGVEKGVIAFRDINLVPGETALSAKDAREFVAYAEANLGADSISRFVAE